MAHFPCGTVFCCISTRQRIVTHFYAAPHFEDPGFLPAKASSNFRVFRMSAPAEIFHEADSQTQFLGNEDAANSARRFRKRAFQPSSLLRRCDLYFDTATRESAERC